MKPRTARSTAAAHDCNIPITQLQPGGIAMSSCHRYRWWFLVPPRCLGQSPTMRLSFTSSSAETHRCRTVVAPFINMASFLRASRKGGRAGDLNNMYIYLVVGCKSPRREEEDEEE
ncbi:hypothetical protein F4775DRAFT_592934 [Biscogniauxia sp. FL1348]|nr:hypothetical protein F4775DRAFT_592934 [Biscogniauxia sp. FL1348]